MRSLRFAATVLAFGTCLTGCAATTTTNKVAVDYNRIFAQSRDEVLVDNILRASAREPMQFSTMGTVSGPVRNNGSITIPFANLIGGKDGLTISPSGTVNEGINPAVSISPLGDKDFTTAILNPVSVDTLNYFLNQGWDPEFVLTLAVGGVICDQPDGTKMLVLNRGQRFEHDENGNLELNPDGRVKQTAYEQFKRMFAKVGRLPILAAADPEEQKIRMTAKDALALLKDGIGSRKIKSIVPVGEAKGQSIVEVTVSTPPDSQLVLDARDVCQLRDQGFPLPVRTQPPASAISGSIPLGLVSAPAAESVQANGSERTKKRRGKRPEQAAQKPKELKVHFLLRSVESMIYFLGETQRDRYRRVGCDAVRSASENWPDYLRKWPTDPKPRDLVLLRIDKLCGAVLPPKFRAFTETKFHDEFYYVRLREDTSPNDLTLSTLTFLDELISLQTSPSSITAVTPVVDVGPK